MKFIKSLLILASLSLAAPNAQALTLKIKNCGKYQYCKASIMNETTIWLLDTRNYDTDILYKGIYDIAAYIYKYDNDPYPMRLDLENIYLENDGNLIVDASDCSATFCRASC